MPETQCHRCGENLLPGQIICTNCGAGMNRTDTQPDYSWGTDFNTSAMFEIPTSPIDQPIAASRMALREHNRLMTFMAVGLALASIIGGILHHLYYLRVGNHISSMLPRNTAAYVRMGKASVIEEGFQSLDVWKTSRPVRERVRSYEQKLLKTRLFDLGINYTFLQKLKGSLSELHFAVVPNDNPKKPHDLMLFMTLMSDDAATAFVDRIRPYFFHSGDINSVPLYVRRAGKRSLSVAQWDKMVALCLGSSGGLQSVLLSRESGPSRSLNDEAGFRAAFRDRGRQGDIWTYMRPAMALHTLLLQTLKPYFPPAQRDTILNAAKILGFHDLLSGVGLEIDFKAGDEVSRIGLYPEASEALTDVAENVGTGQKRTLSAIPARAIGAAAISVADPPELFGKWYTSFVETGTQLGIFTLPSQVHLNRIQAESGVMLDRDIWSNFANELAFALVPRPDDNSLGWLAVIQVHRYKQALNAVARIAKYTFKDYEKGNTRVAYRWSVDEDLNQLVKVEQTRLLSGNYKDQREQTVLCWTASGTRVLLASDCGTLYWAREADSRGTGLDNHPDVKAAMENQGPRNTVLSVWSFEWLADQFLANWPGVELVDSDFRLVSGLNVLADRVELSFNISPLFGAFLWATSLFEQPAEDGDFDACQKLVEVICSDLSDEEACATWQTKVAGSGQQSCRTGLRTMSYLLDDES